jgi:hypothetical protein
MIRTTASAVLAVAVDASSAAQIIGSTLRTPILLAAEAAREVGARFSFAITANRPVASFAKGQQVIGLGDQAPGAYTRPVFGPT